MVAAFLVDKDRDSVAGSSGFGRDGGMAGAELGQAAERDVNHDLAFGSEHMTNAEGAVGSHCADLDCAEVPETAVICCPGDSLHTNEPKRSRCAKVQRLCATHPGRIPVICRASESSQSAGLFASTELNVLVPEGLSGAEMKERVIQKHE